MKTFWINVIGVAFLYAFYDVWTRYGFGIAFMAGATAIGAFSLIENAVKKNL